MSIPLPTLLFSPPLTRPSSFPPLFSIPKLTSRSHTLFPKTPTTRIVPTILHVPLRAELGSRPGSMMLHGIMDLIHASPPTWKSSVLSNIIIFILGSPLLATGLSASGIATAFLLGCLTWRAFGGSGFLLVATYFIIGTAVTKLKIAQKEAEGIAEKKRGRRGPGSVIGSSAAGCVCAILSIYGFGGVAFSKLWQLGFLSSFCTKLSDTVSSEIGKAYGRTTYLVTTFKVVPRGTEGAISVEGTLAGVSAASVLAGVGYYLGEVDALAAVICVVASQIANIGESLIGASLQDKEGFQWLNNDIVNIINITIGTILAVLMQQIIMQV